MTETKAQPVTIDGKEYNSAELSEGARTQIMQVKITDEEIKRLKRRLAIAQTARTAYAKALKAELSPVTH